MAPKNKKAQKVLLTDFLADTSTGRSWADEMDELPTAPAPRDPNEPSQGGLGGSHLSRHDGNRYPDRDQNRRGGDRDGFDRPSRAEIPVPDKPPFNAFVGNLSWEIGSAELEEFFGASHIVSIRMISDNMTGKPKGYGYIEFDEREALVAAMDKSGREIGGRPVRVSVAEPPKEREDRTGGAWRREGPLPPSDDNNRRTRHFSHQEHSAVDDTDRGERMGFGSKFVPSSNAATGMTRRTQSGRGFSRAEGGSGFESESFDRGERLGFGSKFVARADEPKKERDPPQRGSNFVPSRTTPGGSEDGHSPSGAGMRKTSMLDRKATEAELTAADSVSSWRRAKPVATSDQEVHPSAPPAAPATRRKLELTARTVASSNGAVTPPTSNKPSPFGAAKPIDTTEREKEIQVKLDRERTELTSGVATKSLTSSVDGKSSSEITDATKQVATAKETSVGAAGTPAGSKVPKPNPFGGANPVDTLQKELAIEEKLAKQKALREEKLSKEAEVNKPVAPTNQSENALSKPSTRDGSSANTSSHWNQQSSNPSKSQSGQTRSAWGPQSSKPIANGQNGLPPSSVATSSAPSKTNKNTATSPKSPSLSSFRKEGVSFAALAKTAAATASNPPTSGVASSTTNTNSPAELKSSTDPTKDDNQKSKSSAPAHHQQARTILKRVEGLEIQNE